ncbi:MAG: hypothetical protein IPJ90_04550 [Anaerolineaceae bacterium]|jgi:expansin (peptidoglycan-binding protein)|nr:hypothetical protein [Anaerolineaceae bacterium]
MKKSPKRVLYSVGLLLLSSWVGLMVVSWTVRDTAVSASTNQFTYLPLIIKQTNDPVPFGPVHTGDGTYYYATGEGNCAFDPSPQNMMIAALNHVDYANAAYCGAYIQVTGPQGSVMVRIVDQCANCPEGDVDLSVEAFAKIAPISAGRVPISWQFVSPPLDGPVQYYFKSDSHNYWMALQMRNHRNPIAKFEFWNGSSFVEIPRASYNYYEIQSSGGPFTSPFRFRVTDSFGNVLVDNNIPFSPGVAVNGSAQFPAP